MYVQELLGSVDVWLAGVGIGVTQSGIGSGCLRCLKVMHCV